jgi:hypothetical protein
MTQLLSPKRELPSIAANISAAEYVNQATKAHEAQLPQRWIDRNIYPTFRWIGDAMLAVPPVNRVLSAIGLTLGLTASGAAARTLTGRRFDGEVYKVAMQRNAAGIETKVVKNPVTRLLYGRMGYDPVDNDIATRTKKIAAYAIFALGGAIGVMIGTKLAYRSTYKKNSHPEFLEEYDARSAQEQGDAWTPLTALSSIFGSSSGFAMIPIPGLNYALSLSSRTVLMQNRNNMTPGIHKWASGTPTSSTLGVREGLQDLITYAVGNPAETPALLEFKSYHILGQLFPDVKAEQIQQFVAKIHALRDPYLVADIGVPKERKKELEAELTAHFTKAGFEDTLIEIGLNPRAVDFTKMNGAMGRMGNRLGAKSKIEKLEKEYHTKLDARHPDLPKNGEHFLPKPSNEPIAEVAKETPSFVDRTITQKKEVEPRAASFQDQHNTEKSVESGMSLSAG